MIVYPLTAFESNVIRWITRAIPAVTIAVIALLGAISMATAGP